MKIGDKKVGRYGKVMHSDIRRREEVEDFTTTRTRYSGLKLDGVKPAHMACRTIWGIIVATTYGRGGVKGGAGGIVAGWVDGG